MSPSRIVATLVLVAVVGLFLWRRRGDTTPELAHRLVGAGARLVDVRSPGEFASGHLDGAINIPVGEIEARRTELGDPARPIVLYCASGTRSAMAASALRAAGFAEVHNLGAMSRW